MTGMVIISLMYRTSPPTSYRFSWGGVALLTLYVSSIFVLYLLG
jgi:hypothetical protein